MTRADTLLEKLANLSPTASGRQTLSFVDASAGAALRLDVDRVETLGCQLWEASVTRAPAAVADATTLAGWAARVADKVAGLLEPLRVFEVDERRGQALLRSAAPARREADLHYYEVLLEKTGVATLRRYHNTTTPGKREQVSFVLTREALGLIVADLAG